MSKNAQVREYMEKLTQYVPIVARVHGENHPEFMVVQEVFTELNKKIEASESRDIKLDDQFAKLRQVTTDYTVPADTCESYQAVYHMLSELDKLYYLGKPLNDLADGEVR